MITLKNFWPPSDKDHKNCLFTEAELASNEVFLAVHQPVEFIKRDTEISGDYVKGKKASEDDLLEYFLGEARSSRRIVVPIIGDTGIGKSHMIAWLDAQLRIRQDAANRHVVRIPKSASLKGVLDLMVKGLVGEQYEEIRNRLRPGTVQLLEDDTEGPEALRNQFRIELKKLFEAAIKDMEAGGASDEDRKKNQRRKAHCHDESLVAYLNEPEIDPHFVNKEKNDDGERIGVIARIWERTIKDKVKNTHFTVEDFNFIDSIDDEKLSSISLKYHKTIKKLKRRQDAVDCLNEVRDAATKHLLRFTDTDTLPQIFSDLREILNDEGKELILLVEDFAVLAGIQDALLDTVVGTGAGGQESHERLCVIRTALACTAGRLHDTVLSRTDYTWEIDSNRFVDDVEGLKDYAKNLVGGFLNAARWGESEIKKLANQENNASKARWLVDYYDYHSENISEEDRIKVDDFGKSSQGHHLFPFNDSFFEVVLKRDFKTGFKPRDFLMRIINRTIFDFRTKWLDKKFPHYGYLNFEKSQLPIQQVIEDLYGADAERLIPFLYFWGGTPKELTNITLPKGVCDAFDLPVLDNGGQRPPKRPPKPPTVPVVQPQDNSPKSREICLSEKEWESKLKNWRESNAIDDNAAKSFKNEIIKGLNAGNSLEFQLIDKFVIQIQRVELPHINIPRKNKNPLVIKENRKWFLPYEAESVVVRSERSNDANEDKTKSIWNYDGGEDDAVHYANLISDLAEECEMNPIICSEPTLSRNDLKVITKALMISGKILGLGSNDHQKKYEDVSNVFSDLSISDDGNNEFSRFRYKANEFRKEVIKNLLKLVSARQGNSETHAVDGLFFLELVEDLESNDWKFELEDEAKEQIKLYFREHMTYLRDLNNDLEDIVLNEKQSIVKDFKSITKDVGDNWTEEIKTNFLITINKASDSNTFRPRQMSASDLRSEIEELSNWTHVLENKGILNEENKLGVLLNQVGRFDRKALSHVHELLEKYKTFLKETKTTVDQQIGSEGGDPEQTMEQFKKELGKLTSILENIKEG